MPPGYVKTIREEILYEYQACFKEELRRKNYEMDMRVEKDLRDRTKRFALQIMRMFSALPKTVEAQLVGKQVLRSGTSVGANYREAYRSRSRAEFLAKAGDSLKELEETAYWLELLVEGGIVQPEQLAELQKECDELIAIFVTIVKRTRKDS